MNNPAKLVVAVAVSGVVCAVVALPLVLGSPAQCDDSMTHDSMTMGHVHAAQPAPADATFYSEMAEVDAHMHEGMAVAPSGDVDRDFVRMMIPHHQGAVDMARVLLKYGHDERLKRLAQSIIVEQGQEIAYMRTLQGTLSDSSGAQAPTTHHTDQ